jgi:hypothetical protein
LHIFSINQVKFIVRTSTTAINIKWLREYFLLQYSYSRGTGEGSPRYRWPHVAAACPAGSGWPDGRERIGPVQLLSAVCGRTFNSYYSYSITTSPGVTRHHHHRDIARGRGEKCPRPCLDSRIHPKFYYVKRRFSITSKYRQMYEVLNVDKIIN